MDVVAVKKAIPIMRAAIIGLLAQGHIQIWYAQSHRSDWGGRFRLGKATAIVVQVEQNQQKWPAGALEERIHRVLRDWVNIKRAKEWPEGPSIRRLVYKIYDQQQQDPQAWLGRLVADDASDQGYGEIDWTGPRPFFRPDAEHASQLEQEWETLVALSHRLAELHPDLSHTLNREIKKGIRSRQLSRDSYC